MNKKFHKVTLADIRKFCQNNISGKIQSIEIVQPYVYVAVVDNGNVFEKTLYITNKGGLTFAYKD